MTTPDQTRHLRAMLAAGKISRDDYMMIVRDIYPAESGPTVQWRSPEAHAPAAPAPQRPPRRGRKAASTQQSPFVVPPGYPVPRRRPFYTKVRYYVLLVALLVVAGIISVVIVIARGVDKAVHDEAIGPSKPVPAGTTVTVSSEGKTAQVDVSDLVRVAKSALDESTGVPYRVTVTYRGVKGSFPANPLYFTAHDAQGDSYDLALAGADGQLTAEDVEAGTNLRGFVTYAVAPRHPIVNVVMESPLGQHLATWTFGQ